MIDEDKFFNSLIYCLAPRTTKIDRGISRLQSAISCLAFQDNIFFPQLIWRMSKGIEKASDRKYSINCTDLLSRVHLNGESWIMIDGKESSLWPEKSWKQHQQMMLHSKSTFHCFLSIASFILFAFCKERALILWSLISLILSPILISTHQICRHRTTQRYSSCKTILSFTQSARARYISCNSKYLGKPHGG